MTYGRVHCKATLLNADGATVSHLAELVRGNLRAKAPSSPLRGTFSPRGEGLLRSTYRSMNRSRHSGGGIMQASVRPNKR